MALDWLTGGLGGGVLSALGAGFGGIMQANAVKDATDQQAQAAANTLGFQRKVYGDISAQLHPFVEGGTRAFNQLGNLTGTGHGPTPGVADYSKFFTSPDYQWALDQGNRAQSMGAAAQGNYLSGGQLRAGQQFGQGLATQQYGNYFNRLLQLATIGQNSAANQATFGSNMSNTIGNNMMAQGQIQGAGTIGQANAYASIFPNALQAYGQLRNYSNNSAFSPQTNSTTGGSAWMPT